MPHTTITPQLLETISRDHIHAAGPRYSPSRDPNAPNLEIPSLWRAIEVLNQSDGYRARLGALAFDLDAAASDSARETARAFNRRASTPSKLLTLLARLNREKVGTSSDSIKSIITAAKFAGHTVRNRLNALRERRERVDRDAREYDVLRSRVDSLEKIARTIGSISSVFTSRDFELVSNNRMLLVGEWGTGKTHALADITLDCIAAGHPALLILAHRIPPQKNILRAICRSNKIGVSPSSFLSQLNSLGKQKNGRALLIIDGINEGDRATWRDEINNLADRVAKYPNIGLILSCRTPFEEQIFDRTSRRKFVAVVHEGFQEIEFDAQREFFKYYKIPTPNFPLLTPEFSRPLFLKIMCETIEELGKRSKKDRIHKIASGQKGMTKMLEDFVNKIGKGVEADHGLPAKVCWRVLKGITDPANGTMIGVAPMMARRLKKYIYPSDLESIVNQFPGLPNTLDAAAFCKRIITDGLLVEDSHWQDGNWETVIRLPYERFSDHIICRHLLENYLDKTSEDRIRRSFYKNRPLGRIFEADEWGGSYTEPELASAITLEFPEQVRRRLNGQAVELVDFLPKKRRLAAPHANVFLEGLLWRDSQSFSVRTGELIGFFIKNDIHGSRHEAFETLVCLASRPDHPFDSARLMKYLRKFTIAERDVMWSEFVRRSDRDSASRKLIEWIETDAAAGLKGDAAKNLIRLCSLFLTITDRPTRDRVTKALVLLGENNPAELFAATLESFDLNDPYVRERMLAASYGILMRNWAFPATNLLYAVTGFARAIYDLMFGVAAPFPTKHSLIRDFALGIIAISRKLHPNCLGRRPLSRLKEPFDSPEPFPDPSTISDADVLGAEDAFRMDFSNYTIGGLISGRANYDSTHAEYAGVLRQIKWRVLNLGFDKETFDSIDSSIANMSYYRESANRSEKIDRYGKKYSWIAYFEMRGARVDRGKYERLDGRPRDANIDIDPSFPAISREWKPPLKNLFRSKYSAPKRWIRFGPTPSYEHLLSMDSVDGVSGPWTLLDGFVQEVADGDDPRQMFTFVRGLLMPKSSVNEFAKRYFAVNHPGSHQIADPYGDNYTFAGEIPWSKNFGLNIRTKNGKVRRHLVEAFESGEQRTVRKRFADLSIEEKRRYVSDEDLIGDLVQRVRTRLEAETSTGSTDRPAPHVISAVPKFVNVQRYVTLGGISVELPVYEFGWESHHSTENNVGNIKFVAPAICEFLELKNIGNSTDLYKANGDPASLLRSSGNFKDSQSRLLFIRTDMFERYLKQTGQVMVWAMWGEREIEYEQVEKYRTELQPIWSKYDHIHRKLFVHEPGNSQFVKAVFQIPYHPHDPLQKS
ncbi:MAG TPA: hypothetical protein PKD26_16200 [Pyrinomonadaceae bacterium]|nr:hypothetical protein [Pyrinomonadaceae bacterium]